MKPKDLHNFEQAAALIRDSFPPLLKGMYDNFLKEGFTPDQAMTLLYAFLHGIASRVGGTPS